MLTIYYSDEGTLTELTDKNKIKKILSDNSIVSYIKAVTPTDEELDLLSAVLHFHIVTIKNYASKKHLPKIEEYDSYLSTIMYDIKSTSVDNCFNSSPVSIIMTEKIAVTLSSEEISSSNEIYSRFSDETEVAFKNSSTLYYTILDILVDNLFNVLSCFEEELDILQGNLLNGSSGDVTQTIMLLRKKLLELRKIFSYEQEVLYNISHEELKMITKEQISYFKNIFHHLEKLNATLQEYNDWASTLSDAYNSLSSSKVNDRLQLLTIISFIFLPLSFLTGWYGMNFKYMPELEYDYGYFVFVAAVILITVAMIVYFKKKKLL